MSTKRKRPRFQAKLALDCAVAIVDGAGRTEIGGVLFGVRSENDVWVTGLSEVQGRATAASYTSAESDRNEVIARHLQCRPVGELTGYVGTWHSHPGPSRASPTDRRTLRAEAASAPDLVAMVVLYHLRDGWGLDGYVAHHDRQLGHRLGHRTLRRKPWLTEAELTVVP